MNSVNKSKRKPRAPAKSRAELPLLEPNTTDVTILLFPVNVCSERPPDLEEIVGNPKFSMEASNFGSFAQHMFSAGLVFNLEFTEAELAQLPSWSLFDRKIMEGISALPTKPELPPRPSNMQTSANATLWSFIKCHSQARRNHPGRLVLHFNPPSTAITPSMYDLEVLIQALSMGNPISPPDNGSIPQHLIIIAPRFPGFVTGLLSGTGNTITIPPKISRFGSHACFGYRVLEAPFTFTDLHDTIHSVKEICGTANFSCPRWSPPTSPGSDATPLPLTGVLSPRSETGTVITAADYCFTDEQSDEWISRLQQEVYSEGISPGSQSAGSSSTTRLSTPVLPALSTHSKRAKRLRGKSSGNSQDSAQAAISVSTAIQNARNVKKLRAGSPSTDSEGGKGKDRAAEIIGLSLEPPPPPPFRLPSIDAACGDAASLWPKRISPSALSTPSSYDQDIPCGMNLGGNTAEDLGKLLLYLIEYIARPTVIDVTLEEFGGSFIPPANTSLTPAGVHVVSGLLDLVAGNTTYSIAEGVGYAPRRTAFQTAIQMMVTTGNHWKEMGDVMVPDSSPVTNSSYWHQMGILLALALLAGENVHPISPVVTYALLSNTHPRSDAMATMHLSLQLINEFDRSKAVMLLPWMIIPSGQDWKSLPDGHRNLLRQVITNLDIDSSKVSTKAVEEHIQWTAVIVTAAMFGNPFFFATVQFKEMLRGFKLCLEHENEWFQASEDLHTSAAIALELANTTIHHVGDLWSKDKIEFSISPEPRTVSRVMLEEIVLRSVEEYLKRPGHVTLPGNMIESEEFERERGNPLLRVRKFWEYWHGSKTLNSQWKHTVNLNVRYLNAPHTCPTTEPPPIEVHACFDKLEIKLNKALMDLMRDHLIRREKPENEEEDTGFECWIHAQIYQPEYNMV